MVWSTPSLWRNWVELRNFTLSRSPLRAFAEVYAYCSHSRPLSMLVRWLPAAVCLVCAYGYWPAVLEKAYGQYLLDTVPLAHEVAKTPQEAVQRVMSTKMLSGGLILQDPLHTDTNMRLFWSSRLLRQVATCSACSRLRIFVCLATRDKCASRFRQASPSV